MFEGYLLLKDENGRDVEGEAHATDTSGESNYKGMIEILDFGMGDAASSTDDDDDDETDKKKADPALAKKGAMNPDEKHTQLLNKVRGDDAGKKKKKKKKKGEQLTFHISKLVDSASADLFLVWCRTQVHKDPVSEKEKKIGQFEEAQVHLCKMFYGESWPYMTCRFSDVEMTSYKVDYDDGEGLLVEDITFKFKSYIIDYTAQTPEGKMGKTKTVEGTVSGNTAAGQS